MKIAYYDEGQFESISAAHFAWQKVMLEGTENTPKSVGHKSDHAFADIQRGPVTHWSS